MWDVGGQRTLRAYWRNYYESTDGLVWVLDASDCARLGDVAKELHALLEEEKLAGSSLLVLANKQDIAGAQDAGVLGQALGLESLSKGGRHVRLVGVSAVTGEGLLCAFEWLVADIASRLYAL